MFKPWPRLIERIDGPRLWICVDGSRNRSAIVIKRLSAERYRLTVDYLARINGLVPVTTNCYEAPLLDQIADTMVDLAFLNRHGTAEEGFAEPTHWRKP